jgi:ABC-2 type transport system permease protein
MKPFLLPAYTLFKREVVRFLRQRSRVIGAVGTPLLFWVLLGTGLNHAFSVGQNQMSYLNYFFAGIIVMTLLFTAIFSTISIIEDRREGFLQAVLVAPVSRLSFVTGKLLGGAALATLQGAFFLLLTPFLGIHLSIFSTLVILALMFMLSLGLTGLGFVIAWRLDSTQGFHAVMNLFLMPLWFLSGSVFPVTGAPGWLKALMLIDPLTYSVTAMQNIFYPGHLHEPGLPSTKACLLITIGFAALMIALSDIAARKTEKSA